MSSNNNKGETKLQEELSILQKTQQQFAEEVRNLKKNKAAKDEIDIAVKKLLAVKEEVEKKVKELKPQKVEFPRVEFARLMTQRFFLAPSFEIYGGVAGLYDLGPPGTAIKSNILSLWRQHFVLEEGMLEVDCASVTPSQVLTISGHTAKFSDLMVRDVKNGNCFRADHLLEHHLDNLLQNKSLDQKLVEEYTGVQAKADAVDREEMHELLQKYNVKAPETNNDLSFPEPFNLMFQTDIGPTGQVKGFLRPETAQGIFVNFRRLLEFNGGKLPFAGAQIGQAFRNEIAPRSGLLRVREFTLAEIEHFVNPNDKSHPKFTHVAAQELTLYPREAQGSSLKTVSMRVGDAVAEGLIDNETVGYFMARVHLFLVACGIKPDRLRFRQHLRDEMAHYACDCWDAEVQTSYGWVECVGVADRACYDLSVHGTATNQSMTAFVEFPNQEVRTIETLEVVLDKGKIGKQFKGKGQLLIKHLGESTLEEAKKLEEDISKGPVKITLGSEEFEVTPDMIKNFKKGTKRVAGEQVVPSVIEPSFGIGRILYSVLEHSYHTRGDDGERAHLRLPPAIAPVKVSLLPLRQTPELNAFVPKIVSLLNAHALSSKVDDGGQSIGKRYARTDEIGIPFGITIDTDTLVDQTVTLRERDSMAQVRIAIDKVAQVIQQLVLGSLSWETVFSTYPVVESKE